MITIVIIMPIVIVFYNNYIRAVNTKSYTECISNCMNVGKALERYADNNNGKYPSNLAVLSPQYINSIPTCPAAKLDTYSQGYKIGEDLESYTFYCSGHFHKEVGCDPNYPLYSSCYGSISHQSQLARKIDYDIIEHAIATKSILAMKRLLNKSPQLLNAKNPSGETSLMKAVDFEREDVIEFLIFQGSKVNESSKTGWTALDSAISKGNIKIVKVLVEKGAKIDNSNIEYARKFGQKEILEYLIKQFRDKSDM